MKKRAILLLVAMLISICICSFITASAEEKDLAIGRYMELYGYDLPQSVKEKATALFEPFTMDCGEVTAIVNEILYDGCWLYTVADIVPKDPARILILPGSAFVGDLVSGSYEEKERTDKRTFIKAAKEDGKRLLAVYAYPKEFDMLGAYFMDHFQEAEDTSILLSGANLLADTETITVTWSIQVYEVDLITMKYSLIDEYTQPLVIKPLAPIIEKQYIASGAKQTPFDSVYLVQSGLTTYVHPMWRAEEDAYRFETMLFNNEMKEIPNGAPPEAGTVAFEQLPKAVYIQLRDLETGTNGVPILLNAK
jgi:hypothetical protein